MKKGILKRKSSRRTTQPGCVYYSELDYTKNWKRINDDVEFVILTYVKKYTKEWKA
jgi:hypothetical protein